MFFLKSFRDHLRMLLRLAHDWSVEQIENVLQWPCFNGFNRQSWLIFFLNRYLLSCPYFLNLSLFSFFIIYLIIFFLLNISQSIRLDIFSFDQSPITFIILFCIGHKFLIFLNFLFLLIQFHHFFKFLLVNLPLLFAHLLPFDGGEGSYLCEI